MPRILTYQLTLTTILYLHFNLHKPATPTHLATVNSNPNTMYVLPLHHTATVGHRHHHHHNSGVYCVVTTPIKTRPNPKPLVINNTPLITPPKFDDPSLKSTWPHRAWVAAGCTTVLASLATSIVGSVDSHIWFEPVLSAFIGYLFADFGSGVYHWGIDNYGNASTPLFGSQIDAFQGHHKWPWTITKRQFANNLHALARVITYTVLPIDLIFHDQPIVMGFVGTASGCIMFSQQFHSWAHGTKSKLPPLVASLQDIGLLVSRSQHAAHHRPPYNNNYCIVSGVWNKFLDENKVFEALEMVVFFEFGLRPRSWSEPNPEWTEEEEDSLVISRP